MLWHAVTSSCKTCAAISFTPPLAAVRWIGSPVRARDLHTRFYG